MTRDLRPPGVFNLDEVERPPPDQDYEPAARKVDRAAFGQTEASVPQSDMRTRRGMPWGALLGASAAGLASLAFSLWLARFISIALERQDWLGWTAFVLAAVMVFSGLALVMREVIGFFRLTRLERLKTDAVRALRDGDVALERATVGRIADTLSHHDGLKWALANLREHEDEIRDAGDFARLADRELLASIDGQARRLVARTARRVSVATAISPAAILSIVWVLIENLRLLRAIATLYGGRPGLIGTARLGRMVLTHIVATGGVAMTEDLLGQFLGHDLLRRLSRRLGEGIFNGALIARMGAAAIEVVRPLPYLEARPVRARDFLAELTRRR